MRPHRSGAEQRGEARHRHPAPGNRVHRCAAGDPRRWSTPPPPSARSLAALFNPILYPGVGQVLRITQQELAYLVGLSRQRVNEALTNLSDQGTIKVEYGGLRVLDIYALRTRNF